MNITTKIWNSGWGAVFLTIYAGIAIHLWFPDQQMLKAAAIVPVAGVMFLAEVYSNQLIDYFAGGELRKSADEIWQLKEGHFYESANEAIQNRVTKFDTQTYQQLISIIAGTLIGTSAPVLGWFYRGPVGLVAGVLLGLLALNFLVKRAISELNRLAKQMSEPYKAKYESR